MYSFLRYFIWLTLISLSATNCDVNNDNLNDNVYQKGKDEWMFLTDSIKNIIKIKAYDNAVYLCCGNGIYKSTDEGLTWYKIPINRAVFDLVVIDNVILAATYIGCYRSIDSGVTWERKNNGIDGNVLKSDMTSMELINNRVFSGMDEGGVFWTDNTGEIWNKSLPDSISFGVYNLFHFKGILYMCAYAGGYYMGHFLQGGLFYSLDSGLIWKSTSITGNYITIQNVTVTDKVIIASTTNQGDGAMISYDRGNKWDLLYPKIESKNITSVLSKGDSLFIGTADKGIYFSNDNSVNWKSYNDKLEGKVINTFGMSNKYIFVATFLDNRLYRRML